MKIYLNEIKRILSIRSNQIIILFSLLLAILLSIAPINFIKITYGEGDQVKNLKGKEAIEYIKKAKEPYSGKIHISKKVNEVFTDSQSNNLPPVLSIDINDTKYFYNKVFDYLNKVIENEYPNKAQNQIIEKSEKALSKIKTPYEYYGYYSTDANDYRGFYNTIIIILMVVVAAPIFSRLLFR